MLKTVPQVVMQAQKSLNCITADEALTLCKKMNGIIIDVRESIEYAHKSASNTMNIPRGILEMKMLELYPNSEKAIFIHCASGVRAILSTEQLKRFGYKNVWSITCTLEDICQVL